MVLRYWLDASLATPVQVLVGGRFIRTAVAFLRRCSANMSTLVALSSTMAYTYSCYALIAATARAMSGGATGSAERNMPMDMKQGGGNGASIPSSVQMKSRNESFDFFGFKKLPNAHIQGNFLKPKKRFIFMDRLFSTC